ncbi:MAG: prolipoprotein diacylglyceryl transferase family protein [Acutalibacteraceae bacterium]|nr:prolipoprotein diacylglyceryl transferase family protein [Acutalibacteraceae bacterium]
MFTTVNSLGVELPYYGIMTALGISACFLLIHFTKNKRENIDSIEYLLISLAGAGFAFILSHMLYAIAHYKKILFIVTHPDRLFESLQSFVFYFSDIFGGMVFYGGLIGFCIGAYIYMKKTKLDVNEYSDTLVPCIPLFHAFGRIGCFLAGCCYGIESEFGFTYRYAIVESANGVCRFPVQLLEATENILICVLLTVLLYKCKKMQHGMLIWIYGLIYPVVRFINEFLRGDVAERGFFGVLSTSQWISIFIFVLSLTMVLVRILKKDKKLEA